MILKSNHKTIKIISNIGFIIFMLVMCLLIFIAAQSKLTGSEPSILGHRLYIVDSGSMEPTLPVNALIVVKERSANEVEVGEILTFYGISEKTRITHRLVEIGPNRDYFITKGDANNIEDSIPLKKANIIGTVSLSVPYLGYVLKYLSSAPGVVFLVAIISIFTIIPMIFKKLSNEV